MRMNFCPVTPLAMEAQGCVKVYPTGVHDDPFEEIWPERASSGSRWQSRDQIGVDFGRAGVSATVAVTVVTPVTVITDVTEVLISQQEVEAMLRQARFTLSQPSFDDMHRACIYLARKRGLKRVTVTDLVREAVELFLDHHGQLSRPEGNPQEEGA